MHKPLSAETVATVVAQAFAEGSNRFEWEHVRGDGRHILVDVMLTAIRQGDRRILHVVWSDRGHELDSRTAVSREEELAEVPRLCGFGAPRKDSGYSS